MHRLAEDHEELTVPDFVQDRGAFAAVGMGLPTTGHYVARPSRRLVSGFAAAAFLAFLLPAAIPRIAATVFRSNADLGEVDVLIRVIDRDAARRRISPEQLAENLQTPGPLPQAVRAAVIRAAAEMGVDSAYLLAVAVRESRLDPAARSRRSTAAGLYQFTAETWLQVVKAFGARHGLGDYAQLITIDEDGSATIPSEARSGVLQLRFDPQIAAVMAAELGQDNKRRLERVLGRPVTSAEIYIAHFLGVAQAGRLIAAAHKAPLTPAAQLAPAAAHTNPGVFRPAGRDASASAIVARIEAYFARELPRLAGV